MKKFIVIAMVVALVLPVASASAETSSGGISSEPSCHFGYKYVKRYKECYAQILTVRSGETMWSIAERFGDATKWRQLCLYKYYGQHGRHRGQMYEPGEFNPRHIHVGDKAGGCA